MVRLRNFRRIPRVVKEPSFLPSKGAQGPVHSTPDHAVLAPMAARAVRDLPDPGYNVDTGLYTPRDRALPILRALPVQPPDVHIPVFPMLRGFRNDGETTLTARLNERRVVPVPAELFDAPERLSLLHHAVMSYLASTRYSLARNKGRADVNHSKQDRGRYRRAGHARRGEANASNMRHGGRAFPKTQMKNWDRLINGKAWVSAMAMALSMRWRDGAVVCIDGLPTLTGRGRPGFVVEDIPVTTMIDKSPDREARYLLEERGLLGGSGTLFLLGHDVVDWHEGFLRAKEVKPELRPATWFVRAVRRLAGDEGVEVKRAIDVNIVELLRYRRILFDERGLGELIARLRSERGLLGSPVWPLRLADDPEPDEDEDEGPSPTSEEGEEEDEDREDEPEVILQDAKRLVKQARKMGGVNFDPTPTATLQMVEEAHRGHAARFGSS